MTKPKYRVGQKVKTGRYEYPGTIVSYRSGLPSCYGVDLEINNVVYVGESDLSPLEKTLDELEKGNVVVSSSEPGTQILARVEDLVAFKPTGLENIAWSTIEQLKQFGYTLKQELTCPGCKDCLESEATTGEQCVKLRNCDCHTLKQEPEEEEWEKELNDFIAEHNQRILSPGNWLAIDLRLFIRSLLNDKREKK